MSITSREILAAGARELGIALDDAQLDRFDAFTALLLEWNSKFNLTRITDPEEIAVKHYLDSLSLLPMVKIEEGACIIDVGTGAGLPGISLKIARPDLRLTLLDSVRKRVGFLETAVEVLSLHDVTLVHARAEDAGTDKKYWEQFDLAVSRAVARLNLLAEFCIPFCRKGGLFAAYKGPDVEDEIEEAARAFQILGGKLESVHKFTLPNSDFERSLVVVKKVRHAPAGYPRKAGMPERNPL